MNTKFYLLFILFSFFSVASQTTPAEHKINDKLKKIASTPNLDPKEKEIQLLELKTQSEKLDYKLGILMSGDYLMGLYLKQSRNEEALKLGKHLKIATKSEKDTYGYISSIYNRNALALGNLGLADASLKDLKAVLEHASYIKDKDKKLYVLSQFYHEMGLQYGLKRFENKNLRDSLVYTYNKSIEMAKQISDTSRSISENLKYDYIGFNYMRLGMFYLEESDVKGSLELAERYLLQGLAIYENKRYTLPIVNKTTMLNQLSWLYMEKKEYQKSIDFAKRALELEKQFRDPGNRVESYEFLATSYMELGDKAKSKFYMTEYSFLKDSIADVGRTTANKTINKITKEVEVEHEVKSKKQWMITGVLALIAGIIIAVVWRRRNRMLRKNYEQIIEKLKNPEINTLENISDDTDNNELITDEDEVQNDPSVNRTVISKETETRILKRLKTFERSEKFLKKDLTVSMLSAQININSKYLSEIIKNNKSVNFNGYINMLRINYIVHKLYNEPKFRTYKISYLAEISGYASPQVFVTAFKKITGVTPSYFLQNLEEDNI